MQEAAAGARHAGAALRVRRPPALPAQDQDHAHHQARRLPHPRPAARRRADRPDRGDRDAIAATPVAAAAPVAAPNVDRHGTPLAVLFGSNLGTAESIATRLAQEGTERGFDVTLGALDDHVDDLPRDGAVLVVCSSYNGAPPDNAAAFCRWIAGALPTARRTVWRTRSSAAATPNGPRRTRPCRRCSTTSSPRTAAAASAPAARATPPATSTPPTATGTAACGRTWPPRSACRPRWARRPRPPVPGCRSR